MKSPRFYRRFGYNTSLLPNAVLRKAEAGVRNIEEAESRSGYTIGSPGWELIYFMFLSHLRPGGGHVVVETGTNWGMTSIVIAEAIKAAGGGTLHTIELDTGYLARARANISEAGLEDIVSLHHGSSLDVLPKLMADLPGITAAFLDASHEHDDVMTEFEHVITKLDKTGIVMMDNTFELTEPALGEPARVSEALKTIKARHGGNILNFEHVSWYTPGLAIWQRNWRSDI
jgi:predicted O-methyltransferase YrrM